MCVCVCACVRACVCACLRVTGFWKTNRNVTRGLFHFIGPANSYIPTLPFTMALLGLANWSALLERVLSSMCSGK